MSENQNIPGTILNSISKLAEALAKAQGEFPVIPKDSKVDVYSKPPERKHLYTYFYADLTTIIDKTRPALSKNGISFTQYSKNNEFVTLLMHSSGETLETGFIPCVIPAGADMKVVAGLVTYIKRISLTAALGISADEDVDSAHNEGMDGNSTNKSSSKSKVQSPPASKANNKPVPSVSEAQLKRLYAIGKANGWPSESVRIVCIDKTKLRPSLISKKQYDSLCEYIEKTKYTEKAAAHFSNIKSKFTEAQLRQLEPKKEEPLDKSKEEPPKFNQDEQMPDYENQSNETLFDRLMKLVERKGLSDKSLKEAIRRCTNFNKEPEDLSEQELDHVIKYIELAK